jgi:hypothetical protein
MKIDEFCIQQNSALVEEASAAAESLSDQTAQLTEALSVFRLDPCAATPATRAYSMGRHPDQRVLGAHYTTSI